jgi:hypothetical protein
LIGNFLIGTVSKRLKMTISEAMITCRNSGHELSRGQTDGEKEERAGKNTG